MHREARTAFWIAVVLASLSLIGALTSPLPGVLFAAIYFAIAWGIRCGQQLAAVTGVWFQIVTLVVVAVRSNNGTGLRIATGLLALVLAYFFFRSARVLSDTKGWPWILVMAAWLAFWLCIRPFSIPNASMEDTLLPGDYILVETVTPRLGRLLERGALVVFHFPPDRAQTFTKRVVGLPGDRLRIQNKQLLLNGAPLQEPYARHKTDYIDSYRDNFPSTPNSDIYPAGAQMLESNVRDGELIVPHGKYFVLGDNRDSSLDSRYWGFVSAGDIIGRPVLIYNSNPPGTPSILNERWSRLLKRP